MASQSASDQIDATFEEIMRNLDRYDEAWARVGRALDRMAARFEALAPTALRITATSVSKDVPASEK